ncbi:MAG: TRAP transporter small permease [Deltaproteobacteria bacterium]|jgi:C4-dicarboxylate transporter DctQ subunit|nr:TRAP transporter small permease [Deltaproteobacteria bacterium]
MRKFFDNFEENLILFLLPFMTIVVLTATVARYTGLFSIYWGEELARYCMVYLGYLGISLAMKRKAHIGVTALTDKVGSLAGKRVILLLQTVVILAFCLIISAFLFTIISKQYAIEQQSPALEIPIWIPYAAVPLGMILLAVRTCQVFLDKWRELDKE